MAWDFAGEPLRRVAGDEQQMHAKKLFVHQPGGMAEIAVRIKPARPTVLHHQTAQAEGRDGKHEKNRTRHPPPPTGGDGAQSRKPGRQRGRSAPHPRLLSGNKPGGMQEREHCGNHRQRTQQAK